MIERVRLFDEKKHTRGKGTQGGQFVSKGASGARDTVGYNAKQGSGAGYGAKGGDARVKALQKLLNNMGFKDSEGNPLKVDGKLGPRTTSAIKKLQRKIGMEATGLVTPGLLTRLQHADHKRHVAYVNGKRQASSSRKASLAGLASKATAAAPMHKRTTPRRPAPRRTSR